MRHLLSCKTNLGWKYLKIAVFFNFPRIPETSWVSPTAHMKFLVLRKVAINISKWSHLVWMTHILHICFFSHLLLPISCIRLWCCVTLNESTICFCNEGRPEGKPIEGNYYETEISHLLEWISYLSQSGALAHLIWISRRRYWTLRQWRLELISVAITSPPNQAPDDPHRATFIVNYFIELSSFIYLFVHQDWFLTCLVQRCLVFLANKIVIRPYCHVKKFVLRYLMMY